MIFTCFGGIGDQIRDHRTDGRMSNRQANPPQTPEQILDLLVTRHNMTDVAEILLPLLAADTR